MSYELKFTPYTRIMMTFAEEIEQSPEAFLRQEVIDGYVTQLAGVEIRRDNALKAFVVSDLILAFMLAGNDFRIPYLDKAASEIPVILEALTMFSSFSLMILCHTLFIHTAYGLCLGILSGKSIKSDNTDSDLIKASKTYFDFAVKAFSRDFHPSGKDFFKPGIGYIFAARAMSAAITIVLIFIPILHAYLIWSSFKVTFAEFNGSIAYFLYFSVTTLMNIIGILLVALPSMSFRFTVNGDAKRVMESRNTHSRQG